MAERDITQVEAAKMVETKQADLSKVLRGSV
jgi:hypothetical protein